MEDPLPGEPNPKLKNALLTAARLQAELDDALADLEDVINEVAPKDPLTSEVFALNEKIDKILIHIAASTTSRSAIRKTTGHLERLGLVRQSWRAMPSTSVLALPISGCNLSDHICKQATPIPLRSMG
jgi:hypothetical protein